MDAIYITDHAYCLAGVKMEKRIACTARKVFSTIPHLNGDILAKTLLKYTRNVPNGHNTIQYKIPFLVKKKRSIFFTIFSLARNARGQNEKKLKKLFFNIANKQLRRVNSVHLW